MGQSFDQLLGIAKEFEIKGELRDVEPLWSGLINDTFKVSTAEGSPDYVLQRINNAIFTDVELLQNNIVAVTRHIREKLQRAGEKDIARKVLDFVKVKGSEKTYILKDGKYWRLYVFIPDAETFETVTPEYSYYAGKAFGNFEAMLTDIPECLGESIPDFHNMELRSRQLKEAVADDCPEIDKVDFRMDIFEAFSKGYLESAGGFLTPVERENLPYAALLFPYMQAMRFLADYINGDTYYKIMYPERNLVRTRNQMALFRSALGKLPQMQKLVA